METLVEQIQQLLALPGAEAQLRRHAKLTEGLGLEVRQDAGDGKGRGVFATQSFGAGQLLFKDSPLAAIQHSDNRAVAWVCGHCFRFLGSVEQQMGRQIAAARQAGLADRQAADPDDGSGGSAGSSAQHEAALALDGDAVVALAAGSLRLPHTAAEPLPQPVPCLGGCSEESYCSAACAEAAWQQYHQLLCVGPDTAGSSSTSSKGKAAAVDGSGSKSAERRRAALREFLHHADETNDVFRLAAVVLARTLLAAEQLLEQRGSPGASEGSSAGGSGGEPSADSCWQALLAAWEPFACGHKGLWWEAVSAPPDAAADMRQLAADSLELLTAALPARLARRYPALLSLEVWGSVIGMFELNNLAVYVGSPITRWLQALERLPDAKRAAAYDAAGPYLEALPDELPGCEGNAFYALHSCCNHSCAPNAEAFKRDEDTDGSAVILALRDIAAGEEITLSYIDEEAALAERREQLADYGFACACDKCAAEELAAELGAL